MDERELWRLFFLTGHPEVYLLIRSARETEKEEEPLRFRPAFGPMEEGARQI